MCAGRDAGKVREGKGRKGRRREGEGGDALGSEGQLEREVDESIAHAEREVREHGYDEAEGNVW